jgi:diacylglycerol kinase (ATP)
MINFIINRAKSFKLAAKGMLTMLRYEHNAWLHTLATALVCAAGFYFGLDSHDWCWIVLAIVSVWMAEALNTALELLADVASPDFHPLVGRAKDVAAGAVLIAAIGSVVIALLIFWPYIIEM